MMSWKAFYRFGRMTKRMNEMDVGEEAVFDSAHMKNNFALTCCLPSPCCCNLPGGSFSCCPCVLSLVWMYGLLLLANVHLRPVRYSLTVAFDVWKLRLWLKTCILVHAY